MLRDFYLFVHYWLLAPQQKNGAAQRTGNLFEFNTKAKATLFNWTAYSPRKELRGAPAMGIDENFRYNNKSGANWAPLATVSSKQAILCCRQVPAPSRTDAPGLGFSLNWPTQADAPLANATKA
ncbi:MAG: hypothetical protein P4L76_00150 [Beijerinckiaceae bacterium]|nr:hypothetical protein [Beijerinckiaceae bacterium]